jgi:AraC-like DNA-binding protein
LIFRFHTRSISSGKKRRTRAGPPWRRTRAKHEPGRVRGPRRRPARSRARLVRLVDAPSGYEVLAPLAVREIAYRLSLGEQGGRLRQIAVVGGRAHRIARAIELIRQDYDKPLRIAGLAKKLGMSVSGFHHHFKAVTAMSPLQFQKQLRLQEAQRLLLAGDVDAATAGYRVGYDDSSHFSREYKRLFGEPLSPRDVGRPPFRGGFS